MAPASLTTPRKVIDAALVGFRVDAPASLTTA